MAEVYGNVNVNYSYCKSVAQLKSAVDYILGIKKEQIKEGIQKTRPDLYGAFGCKENGYTWHERNDMVICDLVPTKINRFFGHLGGVSECKKCRLV